MKRLVLLAVPLVGALAYLCLAQSLRADDAALSSDAKFVRDVGIMNTAEINLAKLAKEHASSDAVKKFADHVIKDHEKLAKELKELAEPKNLTVPTEVDRKHQQIADHLANMKGAEFDRMFASNMVADHELAIKKFEAEARKGQDPDLKKWAEKSLKGLKEHLRLAKDTEKELGN